MSSTLTVGRRLLIKLLYEKGGSGCSNEAINAELNPMTILNALLTRWRTIAKIQSQRAVWMVILDDAQLAPKAVTGILRAARAFNFGDDMAQSLPHGVAILPIVFGTVSTLGALAELKAPTGWAPWQQSLAIRMLDDNRRLQCVDSIVTRCNIKCSAPLLSIAQETGGWPVALSYLLNAILKTQQVDPTLSAEIPLSTWKKIYADIVSEVSKRYVAPANLTAIETAKVRNLLRLVLTGHPIKVSESAGVHVELR